LWLTVGTISTDPDHTSTYARVIVNEKEDDMLTLKVESGQAVELGQAMQHGKKTVYIWAIDGDKVQVSCDAPRDVSMLKKYAEIRCSERDCGISLYNNTCLY
jgi:sRNA-binding carbon storage regulator CsrA